MGKIAIIFLLYVKRCKDGWSWVWILVYFFITFFITTSAKLSCKNEFVTYFYFACCTCGDYYGGMDTLLQVPVLVTSLLFGHGLKLQLKITALHIVCRASWNQRDNWFR